MSIIMPAPLWIALLALATNTEAYVVPVRIATATAAPLLFAADAQESYPNRNGFTVTDPLTDEWIADELSKEVMGLSRQLNEEKNQKSYNYAGKTDYTVRDWNAAVPETSPSSVNSTPLLEEPKRQSSSTMSVDERMQVLNAQLEATRLEIDQMMAENESLKFLQDQQQRDMEHLYEKLNGHIEKCAREHEHAEQELEAIKIESHQAMKRVHKEADECLEKGTIEFTTRLEQAEESLKQLKTSLVQSEQSFEEASDDELDSVEPDKPATQRGESNFSKFKKLVKKPFSGLIGRNKQQPPVNGDVRHGVKRQTPVVEQTATENI